jgi:hypothetical protein
MIVMHQVMTKIIDPHVGSQADELSASIAFDNDEAGHFDVNICHLLLALRIPSSGRAKALTKRAVTRSLDDIGVPKIRQW